MNEVIPVLHNVFSVEVVKQFAKICYGLGFKTVVISKPSGAAAQAGVPEAQKLALKKGKVLVVLSGIEDVIEVFKPLSVIFITPKKYAKSRFEVEQVISDLEKGHITIIFGGSEPGISAKEMELGVPMHIDVEDDLGPLGFASITLHIISSASKSRR
ncbi:MAG: RecB-family nuclease [Candidatus Nezhaarchaeota archaeon]|nr:RecB-family nuclease [Candidatus Nezhaarchaeota archaeon]